MTRFTIKVKSSKWLENCFVGRISETANVQSIKESFLLGGFM